MWRLFASSGLVKHEASRFSTARPTYATGSARNEIRGIGERTMTRKLEGRIALITGGSRGIGAAIAKRLAADGASVAITYAKDASAASAVVKAIELDGGKAVAIQADAADAEAVRAAVEKTVATFGRLDVLVNNTGTAIPKTFEEAPRWKRSVRNLIAGSASSDGCGPRAVCP